jgi:predicted lipid-binding transport protein (Tim44 family)
VLSRSNGKGSIAGFLAGVRSRKAESDVDIYTIIFLALAVFIFLRLRNVLGQRTGNERPPFDRAARNALPGTPDSSMVPLPGKVIDQPPPVPTAEVKPSADRWKGWTRLSPRIPLSTPSTSCPARAAPMK